MKSIDRLLGLVLLLMRGRRITAKELAKRFSVDERTIYRDIEVIRRAGLPVASTPGPDGGYVIQEAAHIDPAVFSSDQALSLFFGGATLPDFKSFDNNQALDKALEKLSDVLSHKEKQQIIKLQESVYLDFEEWYWRDKPEKNLQELKQTIIDDNQLKITYLERDDPEIKETLLDPYGLCWKGGYWYLVGWSYFENKYRRYRLQRINRIEKTGVTFQREKDFNLQAFWKADLEAFGQGNTKVVIKINSKVTLELENFNWKAESTISKHPDYWLVEMWVDKYEWIIPLILSYGPNIEAVEPESLRERIADELRTALELYSEETGGKEVGDTFTVPEFSDIRPRATRGRNNA